MTRGETERELGHGLHCVRASGCQKPMRFRGLGGAKTVAGPNCFRSEDVVFREVFRSLVGADNIEAAGSRPLDEFDNQSRLIAAGK